MGTKPDKSNSSSLGLGATTLSAFERFLVRHRHAEDGSPSDFVRVQ